MGAKKRLTTLFCLLALFCALCLPARGSSSGTTVYLLAANDKYCDFSNDALPLSVGGVIYIPYTTFDRHATGVDLGVYYGITPEQGTILTLYSLNGMLTFKMTQGGVCTDNLNNTLNFHAVTRNGIPYVPAAAVCSFFGLQYSYLPTTDRGTLIRITSPSSSSMDDSAFLSASRGWMTNRYNQIVQSLYPQPVSPAVTAAPPAVTRAPNGNTRIYFSIDASQVEGDLVSLFPSGVYALFLFTPDSLPARASQLRKVVAAGHSVGLIIDDTLEPEAALEQLKRGNELLSHIARVKTRIVTTANGQLRGALEAENWAFWNPSFRAAASPATIQTVLGSRSATIRMDLTATPIGSVNRVVSALQTNGYDLQRPLETDL